MDAHGCKAFFVKITTYRHAAMTGVTGCSTTAGGARRIVKCHRTHVLRLTNTQITTDYGLQSYHFIPFYLLEFSIRDHIPFLETWLVAFCFFLLNDNYVKQRAGGADRSSFSFFFSSKFLQ